jgi:dihydrofolate synthase/folylpolyglutamate synthase
MNYKKTLAYLLEQLPMYQRIGKLAYRSGLDNTLKLDEYFNHPHRHFRTIHVAGTNGKGSVSHMLASVLQEAGFKTGLYTSPHLLDFRERIRVNGRKVSKGYVAEFMQIHQSFFATFNPSFFEISVFMAFTWFERCRTDVAVIEVGLGGRLDATNIITPEVSVITNIGKDHTDILGETLEKIAVEKAGIIKKQVPVVVGESHPQTLPVFSEIARHLEAPLTLADKTATIDYSAGMKDGCQIFQVKTTHGTKYINLKCGLLGHYQRKNVLTVLETVHRLRNAGWQIPEKSVYAGIRKVIMNTGLAGRWQIIQNKPLVVCDTAHNADGLKLVLRQIAETPFSKLHMIIGFVSDKDVHEILKLMPHKAEYYFTRLSVPRTMDENVVADLAVHYGINGKTFGNVRESYLAARERAEDGDLIVITGSNFLVGDFLEMTLPPEKVKIPAI